MANREKPTKPEESGQVKLRLYFSYHSLLASRRITLKIAKIVEFWSKIMNYAAFLHPKN